MTQYVVISCLYFEAVFWAWSAFLGLASPCLVDGDGGLSCGVKPAVSARNHGNIHKFFLRVLFS